MENSEAKKKHSSKTSTSKGLIEQMAEVGKTIEYNRFTLDELEKVINEISLGHPLTWDDNTNYRQHARAITLFPKLTGSYQEYAGGLNWALLNKMEKFLNRLEKKR